MNEFKAVFIFKFIKFINWPDTINNADVINVCIIGDDILYESINIFDGRKTKEKKISVLKKSNSSSFNACNMLYIGSSKSKTQKDIIIRTKGENILTIGHSDNFLGNGGMINFLVEKNRLNFEINYKSAKKENIRIRSTLLMLAKRVID
ncbi:MAG: DUF4154 domain-containing protein [Candidatus Dadabacteria bacterium]|nr:DUF4154 domain-containing protein [Candidatus Dadabacteria bacterium]NIQ14015.1 DUF4154 domain-containing protein [Candidatus Dadabacteria bacterium]